MEALFSDYEEIRKSGLFDSDYYLATYPDVGERNVDPLVHYLEGGAGEGRNPHPDFDAAFYLQQCRDKGEQPENPLLHYLRIGAARGFSTKADADDPKSADGRRSRRSQKLAKAPILVAIESLAINAGSNATMQLSVGGWALANTPIAAITVSIGGNVVGTATYGLPRLDVLRLYPNREGAAQSGFILAADFPGLESGAVDAVLNVTTADGEIGHHPLRLEIPPQDLGPEIIDPLVEPEPDKQPMELYIDGAVVDPQGILRLSGWVVCVVQIEIVEAFIDGATVGNAELGRVRTDVEALRPDYPNARFSGFALAADVSSYGRDRKIVTVRATAHNGISQEATTTISVAAATRRPEPRPPADFRNHFDDVLLTTAGRVAVKGWAVASSPVDAITVLLNGEEIGGGDIALPRPDVGNLFPALAHARRSGFAFEVQTGRSFTGEHAIAVRFTCADGETHEAPVSVVASEDRGVRPAEITETADCRLHIDTPFLIDGVVETPVRSNIEIGGWALAKAGVQAIEIAIDGQTIALADYGLRRLDLRTAFPDWPEAISSGFSSLLPHRILPKGSHVVSVTLRDKAGRSTSSDFRMEVEEPSELAGPWSLRRKMVQAEIELSRRIIAHSGRTPWFVVLLPVTARENGLHQARRTLNSLCAQAWPHWRLVIVPPGSAQAANRVRDRLLGDIPALRGRVEVLRNPTAAAIASLADVVGGTPEDGLFTVLTPGDELGCDALLETAVAAATQRESDFFYSDERRRNPASDDVEAFFKPQWSPDLLLSTNYVGRLWCARMALLRGAADAALGVLHSGEYDLVLRCTEAARAIHHIPAVLCERTEETGDQSEQSPRALEQALARRGITGDVFPGSLPQTFRIKRAVTKPGLVSIIIPTCAAGGLIEKCLTTLRQVTTYSNCEIVCIENTPAKDRKWRGWLKSHADRVITTKEPFNWARFNNIAVAQAKGEYLLFLNDDIEIIDPAWLGTLVEQAQRPEIGVVGPRLLYPDRRVQHAGMFLASMGQARHAFRYAAEDAPGYFGLALTQREVIAVTGACLMTRRETFDALGGFDETQVIVNNDLDFCLRARRLGLRNIYTPHARLIHHEAVSRAALDDVYDAEVFDGKWRDLFLAGDPYFSPHLSKNRDDFSIDHEPTRLLVTGGPTLRLGDIRKILVVKLDHIGDCILAFPAVRRLKQHFPDAEIVVLTSRSSRPVWALEASVDRIVEFDFFHARSGLGELKRTDDDYRDLALHLSPERFDLAIDLRKHLETRPVLQHTGARLVAGFDFRNQCPWLDVTLEWTGDQMYARKRQHVAEDLVNLVDAVAAAGETDRLVIATRPPASTALAALLRDTPPSAPLVCVHPTVGNDARQWPSEYFAAVINRLVKEDRARIVLIGGPGDEDVAADILDRADDPAAITSLVSRLPLAELPGLLAGMSLFLGNNSGPKHIAAGLGVPTVGVHSGTEDVLEWGPVGPSAIAVAREVVCAPCYLAKAADCRRGLACLRQLEPARVYEACKRLLPLGMPATAATEKPVQVREPATSDVVPAAGE